jgi:hypothetical protein
MGHRNKRNMNAPFQVDPSDPAWKRGFDDGRAGSVCADKDNQNYLDGWITGDQERYMEEDK